MNDYLNVDEVETALTLATDPAYQSFTELITLPNITWEARICHAVKLGRPSGAAKPAVFFLGGVHAREWGSADILINFVNQLQTAYQTSTGLTFGAQSYTPAQVQDIIDTLDIIVFPQANPDGRHYSMTGGSPLAAAWRKNLRTAAPNSIMCTGVDINRNFDFLWDFATHFAAGSGVATSSNPCDPELYCGPAAFSEPETQNCKWIFDTYPAINAFVDLHSFGQTILYSWGDDESQAAPATMNFQNAMYDGLRGIPGDAYREYLPLTDRRKAFGLAVTLRTAIQAVRGTTYLVQSGFDLYHAPTSGASDDYAYSRHFVDPNLRNIIAFTIEWGTQFIPLYSDMMNIIPEITSGLVAFCLDLCNEENAMAWQNRGNSATNPSTDFVGTTDNEPLVIRSNGSEAIRVTPAGNVGIGIPAPARKLHVGGDAMISAGAIIAGVAVGTDAPAVNYQYEYETVGVATPAFNLRLQSPNSIVCHTGAPTPLPRLTIDGAGNVGIGTTQPGTKLEIKDGDLLFRAAAEDPGDIIFQSAAGAQKARIWSQPVAGAGLYLSSGDNNPDITISAAGNVGIGTNIPLFRLHAAAPGGFAPEDANGVAQAGNVPVVAQSDSTAIGILNANGRPAFALNIEGNQGASNARGFPTLYDRYDGTWHPSLSLKNGNVGIGLNNPVGKCEIIATGPNQIALGGRSAGNAWGIAGVATGTEAAVHGLAEGPGAGVWGHAMQNTGTSFGVLGTFGVPGHPPYQAPGGFGVGVVGYANTTGVGAAGVSDGVGSPANGVEGIIKAGQGAGIVGQGSGASTVAVYGDNAGMGGQAGRFIGDVQIQGSLTVSGKSFRIDHPLDPEHKYLTHSSVESPEMLTVYNGVVVTGDDGLAAVTLPGYFQALNRDFTYQLTVVGEFAQAIIAREIEDNSFTIRTDRAQAKVSWQVTGVRHDRYAEANPIAVEEEKADADRGRYLHPELYELPDVGREAVKPIGHIESVFGGSITDAHQ
jgi:carboxypeptidase T